MAEQQAASFNPDDASGLLDNARVKITKVLVDLFKSKAGESFINVDVTYKGDAEITEHYMLGGADKWAPNATKTGAIALTEGGKIWNKSDVFKLMKSLVDAGFPKNHLGNDLSVLVGTEVHVNRVTQEGATYTDKEGKERQRTTLLVTKIYELPKAAGGTGAATAKGAKGAKATTASAAAAAPASGGGTSDENDAYVMELLVELATAAGGTIEKSKLPQGAFIALTRAKKVALRESVTKRLQDEAFLGSLVEQGLITYDGKAISLAS
jgi:hypothetical protein